MACETTSRRTGGTACAVSYPGGAPAPGPSQVRVGRAAQVLAVLGRPWLPPLRRLRVRLFGRPLPPSGTGRVPLAVSVELLENSPAWQAASSVVRSALLDHWDDEGWRVLRFAGVYEEPGRDARPVSVLFTMDRDAGAGGAPNTAVRVSVIDDGTQEVVPLDLLATSGPWAPLSMV